MQHDGQNPQNGAPPFGQAYAPFTPEQMQQWQQYGIPGQQPTPEFFQYIQQQQGALQQQMTPEMQEQWQYQLYQMQQIQQMSQAPPRKVKVRRERMPRERGCLGRILRVLLVVAALAVGGWFLWSNTRGSAPTTATIEMGTLGTTYRGEALIVRNEAIFEDEGVQSIDYVAQEGSLVYPGTVVCYVYSTGYSSKEMQTLQDYRDQIKDYQRTLLKGAAQVDSKMERLEDEVIRSGLEVRDLVQGSRGNLVNQESILARLVTQRQNYFRSKFADDMRLKRLYEDETTQQQRIDSWIKQRHATRESIVSFYTDGFEHALTPNTFEGFTPSEVRAMINGERPEVSSAMRGRTSIYRLVTKENYAVLMLIKDNTWNPVEGSVHKLKLEQFSNTIVDARILSFTRSGGELLLRLAIMGDVSPVLYMRTCQAELGEYADCMIVPVAAIYEQGGSKGVVLVNGNQQVFVPVNVVQTSDGKAFISAIQTGVLSVGQTVRLF